MTRALVVLVVLGALGACSFERRSPDFTCVTSDECQGGRVCSGGFCVDPSTVGDGGPIADASPFDASATDAASSDAFVCPAACTRCQNGTCIIDCNADSACGVKVVCPIGVPCQVSCGRSACGGGIDCSAASACAISCNQASACQGSITCGDGACDIKCGGASACTGGIDCSSSCACDVSCTGSGVCPVASVCPGPSACRDGNGCTSAPGPCGGCP